jgi:hypothetical protein
VNEAADEGAGNQGENSDHNTQQSQQPEPQQSIKTKRAARDMQSSLGKFWQLDGLGKRQRKPKEAFISTKDTPVDESGAAFLETKRKELQSFEDEQVFVRCRKDQLPAKTQIIATRWVCKWKTMVPNGTQKSQGSDRNGTDQVHLESP